MQHQSNLSKPIHHSESTSLTSIQPSINLFQMESQHTQSNSIEPALHKKSKSFRKLTLKKTPAQVLAQNILKNRQSSRLKGLREITSENIKIYLRLQRQRSAYNFKQIHREQSVDILPKRSTYAEEGAGEQKSIKSRCSSATLRISCKSLKNCLRSSNHTASNLNMQGQTSRKIIMVSNRQDKQNIGSNKMVTSKQLNPVEEKIISNKLGLKLSIPNGHLPISISTKDQNQRSKILKNRPQTCFHLRQDPVQPTILTQRRIDSNKPQL